MSGVSDPGSSIDPGYSLLGAGAVVALFGTGTKCCIAVLDVSVRGRLRHAKDFAVVANRLKRFFRADNFLHAVIVGQRARRRGRRSRSGFRRRTGFRSRSGFRSGRRGCCGSRCWCGPGPGGVRRIAIGDKEKTERSRDQDVTGEAIFSRDETDVHINMRGLRIGLEQVFQSAALVREQYDQCETCADPGARLRHSGEREVDVVSIESEGASPSRVVDDPRACPRITGQAGNDVLVCSRRYPAQFNKGKLLIGLKRPGAACSREG